MGHVVHFLSLFLPCVPPSPRSPAPQICLHILFLPLLSRLSALARALRVSPAHISATPFLPP